MIRWREHPEMVEFMIGFIPGHAEPEIRAAFLERFGIELKESQIGNFKVHYKIKSGTHGGRFEKGHITHNKGKKMSPEMYERCKATMFKPGQPPVNHKEVGSERVDTDGYVMVKVAEPNKWRLKQRLIYERETGEKLTANDVVMFLDGDKTNFDISNLVKMSRTDLVRFNQQGIKSNNKDVTLAAVYMAKIKARRKRKEKNNESKRVN